MQRTFKYMRSQNIDSLLWLWQEHLAGVSQWAKFYYWQIFRNSRVNIRQISRPTRLEACWKKKLSARQLRGVNAHGWLRAQFEEPEDEIPQKWLWYVKDRRARYKSFKQEVSIKTKESTRKWVDIWPFYRLKHQPRF